jgi:hypothetical protein
MRVVRFVVLIAALSAPVPTAFAQSADHASHVSPSSGLVEQVRFATEGFRDSRNVPQGYQSVLGCVSGPDEGAMGVHFVNGSLINGALEIDQPQALIYEFTNGVGRLVGVEYIVPYELWHLTHAKTDPPTIGDQLLNYYDSPNRFGLPPFYELHVWAWRDNPNGAFVDWNPRVSCEGK